MRRTQKVRVVLGAGLALLAASAPAFCQGGFNGPATYEITNRNSNKVVDLDRNDRTTVIQYESRGTDNQRWQIRNADGGYYYIINLMNGQALEATGSDEKAAVRGSSFQQSGNQQWRIESGPNSTAVIVNRNGAVLDVQEGSRDNGARLQMFSRNNSGAQQFLLRQVNSNSGGGWSGSGQTGGGGQTTYEIVNRNSNKVVDLDRSNGTSVIQYDSSGAENQQWEIQDAGGGFSYLVNRMNGHALEAAGSREHSEVRATPLRRTESQQWRLEQGSGGTVIVNRNGAVLDVSEGSRDNGARLQMFSRNNSAAQQFELRRSGSGPADRIRRRRSR